MEILEFMVAMEGLVHHPSSENLHSKLSISAVGDKRKIQVIDIVTLMSNLECLNQQTLIHNNNRYLIGPTSCSILHSQN